MQLKSVTKSTHCPSSTLTSLQNKAIKWIAKLQRLINQELEARQQSYLFALEKQNLHRIKANELQPGHVIRSNKNKRYTVTAIRPHGDALAISADSVCRKHTFYYSPNRIVRVECVQ